MNLKETTRSIAAQLDNDLLGIRLQELCLMVAPFLVYIFVVGETTVKILRKYTESISKLFVYESSRTTGSIQSTRTKHGMAHDSLH